MTATLVMVFAPVAGLGVPCCCRCPWRPQCLSPLGHRSLQSNLVFTPFQSVPLLPRPKTQDAPLSLEAGGYGQTRVTCFVARRLKVVAVDGLLWISWCVLGGADFFVFFFRTHTARCKYEPALPRLPPYLEEGLRCWSGFVRYSGLIGNIYSYLHV